MSQSFISISFAVFVLIGGLLGGCSGSHTKQPAAPQVISGLTTTQVRVEELPETLETVGTVRARTSAIVSARIPGTVTVLHVREGDRVRKGQLLAQLESKESAAQATGAAAAIDESQRGLEEAQARSRLAESTFARFKKLYDEQALTRQEFESRQTELELARQGVARAESRLRQTREAALAAGAMADYSKIIAPVSGIITVKQADLGATVFPGQPLMTIEDEGSYQLELAIPESHIRSVKPGSKVHVVIDSIGAAYTTRITEVVPAADPGSRTFVAKTPVMLKGVRSGMFGRGTILSGGVVKGIMIPRASVFERGSLTAVWAVGKDGIVRMRLVKAGRQQGDRIDILSGLSDGDTIVTAGMDKAVDGARLQSANGKSN